MEQVEGEIYCEIHCCVHEDNDDPYMYGYEQLGEDPECSSECWRKLWVGAMVGEYD